MPPTPKYKKKCKNMKHVKNENHQKHVILEGFSKMDITIEFSVIFYIFQHRSTLIFDIFSKMSFFDIRIVKNCMFLMFWRLGTMLERFFIGKSFRMHISKPKIYQETYFLSFRRAKYFISCQSKVACKFLKEKNPECFKTRFDRLER